MKGQGNLQKQTVKYKFIQKLIFTSTIELKFHQITVNRLKPYLKFCRQPSQLEKK